MKLLRLTIYNEIVYWLGDQICDLGVLMVASGHPPAIIIAMMANGTAIFPSEGMVKVP